MSSKTIRQISLLTAVPVAILLTVGIASSLLRGASEPGANASAKTPDNRVEQTVVVTPGASSTVQAGSKVRIDRAKSTLYFDAQKWKQQGPEKDGRIDFMHVTGDAYAAVIAERPQMTLKALRDMALENARQAATDARILQEERKTVNGREILSMQFKATIEGIPAVFVGYYFTGKEGTVQVVAYTSENLLNDFRTDFEAFLNGFTVEG